MSQTRRIVFDSREVAVYHVSKKIAGSEAYANKPFSRLFDLVDATVAANTFVCLGGHTGLTSLALWAETTEDRLPSFREGGLHLSALKETNFTHVLLLLGLADDKAAFSQLRTTLSETFPGKTVCWDRHRGKIGSMVL